MWSILQKIKSDFIADESGATAIEYALIAALLGIGLIVGYKQIATGNESLWSNVEQSVTEQF